MLFYIPGLLVFIISILIIFFVIPRFAPSVLALTAVFLLIFGIYHHYIIFASEYRLSTWQEGLKFWAGPLMIAILILVIIGYFVMFIGIGKTANVMPTNVPLPAASTATNPVTSAINSTINASKSILSNISHAASGNSASLSNMSKNTNLAHRSNINKSLFEKV